METNGYVYSETINIVYSTPQVVRIANYFLTKKYRATWLLSVHKWRPVNFYLVLDDFGVNYFVNKHADNLITFVKN